MNKKVAINRVKVCLWMPVVVILTIVALLADASTELWRGVKDGAQSAWYDIRKGVRHVVWLTKNAWNWNPDQKEEEK